jgi:DNA-binding PadR family transcriptional regulator
MNVTTVSSRHLSKITLLILAGLEDGPIQVATLKRRIEQAQALALEPGIFYKGLTSLERRGWIAPAHSGDAQPANAYSLTTRGLAALQRYSTLNSTHREYIKVMPGEVFLRGTIMKQATWIVKLYPRAWRERYETEMLAVLAEHHITLFTVLDLLFGVLDARLDPHYRTEQALFSFKRPYTAALTFCAALAVFLLFAQGGENAIFWEIEYLLGFVSGSKHGTVLDGAGLFANSLYLALFAIIVPVSIVSMKHLFAVHRLRRILLCVAYATIPVVFMLLTRAFTSIGWYTGEPLLALAGWESLIGVLLLTIVKGRQALAKRQRGLLCLIVLSDLLLALVSASMLQVFFAAGGLGQNLPPVTQFICPFSTVAMLVLALAGSEASRRTWRLVLVAASLITLIMVVFLSLFVLGLLLIGSDIKPALMGVPGLFGSWLPIAIVAGGILLSTLLAVAALRFLFVAFTRSTPVVEETIAQELPPLEIRQ